MTESSTVSTWRATRTRAASLVTTSLVVAVLATGCTASASAPSAISTASPTMTSSETNVPDSAAERARAAQAVVEFGTELDRLALEPERPLTGLSNVASGQAFSKWHELTANLRRSGDQQVGTVTVRDPSAHYDAKKGAYTVEACLELSTVDVMDKNGTSIVPSDRPSQTRFTYVVA